MIASADEWRALDTLEAEPLATFLALFWKRRDPTPTTPGNEFREQFEARVEYARTRFSVTSQPEPWDRRGEVYVRFGPPDERIDSSFDAGYEKWYYFDQNLKFMFEGGVEGQRLVPFREFTNEVQALPDFQDDRLRMQASGVLYTPPRGERPLDMALDWYPFRRTDGRYDVYVAASVPTESVAHRGRPQEVEIDYTARVVAFDSVLQLQWTDSAHVARLLPRLTKNAMAQTQWMTILPPGFYVVAAELDDGLSRKRAVSSFDRWLVPYEASLELDLSPLVIAAEVRDAEAGTRAFVRNGKEIVPMSGRVFNAQQDVAFYHEVYNLQPDDSGIFQYRVEYTLYDEGRRDRRTLIVQSYRSHEAETFQAGTIPHQQLAKGSYILEVETTDLIGALSKTALARFKVR
jgi:GWxTD domain-containing protein